MRVVGEACDGAEAVALTREMAPDVVVLDLNMPGVTGLEALRQIEQGSPGVQAVVLTVSAAGTDVLAALAAGACGYLLKDTRADRLAEGIRQAAEGHMVLSRDVAQALTAYVRAGAETAVVEAAVAQEAAERRETGEELSALTPREEAVLRLIAGGADNVAIGLELVDQPSHRQAVRDQHLRKARGAQPRAGCGVRRAGGARLIKGPRQSI